MADLRATAPAKVNLHLEVLGFRGDDFHELAMVMQSIDLLDTLLFSSADDGQPNLATDAPGLPSGPDNLILRAAEQLRRHVGAPSLGAAIKLRKRISIGAGLAWFQRCGCSTDGTQPALEARSTTARPS